MAMLAIAVADDQGRQRQGGLSGGSRKTAFPGFALTGYAQIGTHDRERALRAI
jgi:hypothetical protein